MFSSLAERHRCFSIVTALTFLAVCIVCGTGYGQTEYSIGDPTDEEQLLLELVNRSRSDAVAEVQRIVEIFDTGSDADIVNGIEFFNVDLELMQQQFTTLEQIAPPLSMNASLLAAARRHSLDMFENTFQQHSGSDGTTTSQRLEAAGYVPRSASGENIFAFGDTTEHVHAALDVDWGTSASGGTVGGMQDPPGHRLSIHNPTYREVGMGILMGTKTGLSPFTGTETTVGPLIATQDFGVLQNSSAFVTGVAYYDLNGNSFYDVGEGIGGLRVDVDGADAFAVTADSGGYSVPVPSDSSFNVTFGGLNFSDVLQVATVTNNQNVKVDFIPPYEEPALAPPPPLFSGTDNVLNFTVVSAATGYQFSQSVLDPAPWEEGAEPGESSGELSTGEGYDPISSAISAAGSFSYHLVQPNFDNQMLTVNRDLLVQEGSELSFFTRLRAATENQVARAEVSTDGGVSWAEVWSQAGSGFPGEADFTRQVLDLSALAGEVVKVRFVYAFGSGSAFTQIEDEFGFYLDGITVSNADQLGSTLLGDIGNTDSLIFKPAQPGRYLLQVRAVNQARRFPFGLGLIVDVEQGEPSSGGLTGLLAGASELGDGWHLSDWYGFFNTAFLPWIFHLNHSWQFVAEEGTQEGGWIFDLNLGWLFTSPQLFPNLFSHERQAWVFYFDDTTGPRQFVDLQTGEFFNADP